MFTPSYIIVVTRCSYVASLPVLVSRLLRTDRTQPWQQHEGDANHSYLHTRDEGMRHASPPLTLSYTRSCPLILVDRAIVSYKKSIMFKLVLYFFKILMLISINLPINIFNLELI